MFSCRVCPKTNNQTYNCGKPLRNAPIEERSHIAVADKPPGGDGGADVAEFFVRRGPCIHTRMVPEPVHSHSCTTVALGADPVLGTWGPSVPAAKRRSGTAPGCVMTQLAVQEGHDAGRWKRRRKRGGGGGGENLKCDVTIRRSIIGLKIGVARKSSLRELVLYHDFPSTISSVDAHLSSARIFAGSRLGPGGGKSL